MSDSIARLAAILGRAEVVWGALWGGQRVLRSSGRTCADSHASAKPNKRTTLGLLGKHAESQQGHLQTSALPLGYGAEGPVN